jgi:hypothetical protein
MSTAAISCTLGKALPCYAKERWFSRLDCITAKTRTQLRTQIRFLLPKIKKFREFDLKYMLEQVSGGIYPSRKRLRDRWERKATDHASSSLLNV